MGVTVYIFDAKDRRVRMVAPASTVTELIHDEANHRLDATVATSLAVENGEALGCECADGRFRLFEVTRADRADSQGVTHIVGRDLAVYELDHIIIEELQQLDVTADVAVGALINGTRWRIGTTAATAAEKSRAYFQSVWSMLTAFEELYKVRFAVWYEYDDTGITGGVVDILEDKAVFRGRLLESQMDARDVHVVRDGSPVTRLYGLGPATNADDVQTNLTFADTVWSKDGGDPVDKPKGQTWVEDPEAVARYGLRAEVVQLQDATEDDLLQLTWEELQRRIKPKATISATVQDLEMTPGQEHKAIRLGDMVAVDLKAGDTAEARIIGIKRNLLRPWLTKITAGDKEAAISTQVTSLVNNALHTFERLTVYKNRFLENEAVIQLNAQFIQQNAKDIEANAEQIRLNAEQIILAGYVTADELESALLGFETAFADYINTKAIDAGAGEFGDLTVTGSASVEGTMTATTMYVGGEGSSSPVASQAWVSGRGYATQSYVQSYCTTNYVPVTTYNRVISDIQQRLSALEG